MKDNKNVILFGKIDFKQLLEKADYKNIPKLSVLLKSEMSQFEKAIDLKQNIHFALEGPFDQEGNPSKVIAFVRVLNSDSLASKISSLGLMMEKDGDMKFTQDNDLSIGVKQNIAIFISKKSSKTNKFDGKKELIEAFEKSKNDLSEGKIDKILAQKSDITLAVNMQNLYGNLSGISKMPENKEKEFKALMKDSYLQSTISFDNGEAVVKTQNLFSNKLMNRMFLKEDPNATLISKLGKGNARLGVAMNFDMQKLESFLDDFAPQFMGSLVQNNFQLQMASSVLGDKPLSNLMNGMIGILVIGDMINSGSFVPEANIYMGFGNKGKQVSEMLSSLLPKDSDIFGMKYTINEKEITVSSGKSKSTSLIIPSFANSFGKKGITAFMNFDGLDTKSLDLDDEMKFIYSIKNITISVDNRGAEVIIKGKNSSQNILKQMLDVYLKDIEKTLGEIN
jgi:hypothetical protein